MKKCHLQVYARAACPAQKLTKRHLIMTGHSTGFRLEPSSAPARYVSRKAMQRNLQVFIVAPKQDILPVIIFTGRES